MAAGQELKTSSETKEEHIRLAKAQGDALTRALENMIQKEAHGDEVLEGDYLVGYAIEKAEGMYEWKGDGVEWQEPREENCHLEVSVRNAADGRFIPGLAVRATLIDEDGTEVGTHEQPFLWHPWLYHYGRNWTVPGEGHYTLKVRIEPPRFGRHDKVNGNRFTEPVEVTFERVHVKPGRKK